MGGFSNSSEILQRLIRKRPVAIVGEVVGVGRLVERFGCLGIMAAIVLALFVIARLFPTKPPAPVTQDDYEACMAREVARCVAETVDKNLKKSRIELPVMPTREEMISVCRGVIAHTMRLFPEAETCP